MLKFVFLILKLKIIKNFKIIKNNLNFKIIKNYFKI